MNATVQCLIFLATGLFGFTAVTMLLKYLQERLEHVKDPELERLRRFVAPEVLLRRRIFAALSVFCVMFIGQLLAGVERFSIAVPVALGFALLAYFLVYRYYCRLRDRRKAAFDAKVLDFTVGLASSMRSGLALAQSIDAVAHRMSGPMHEELTLLLRDYRLGTPLPEAFERLNRRMPSEDLSLLVTAVALSIRTGGSLAEVLEEMSETIRERTEFYGRLRNMTEQGRFEALVISCAPFAAFLLLYCVDSDLMRPLVTTAPGWAAVGIACALVTVGYVVLKRMVTIEV